MSRCKVRVQWLGLHWRSNRLGRIVWPWRVRVAGACQEDQLRLHGRARILHSRCINFQNFSLPVTCQFKKQNLGTTSTFIMET